MDPAITSDPHIYQHIGEILGGIVIALFGGVLGWGTKHVRDKRKNGNGNGNGNGK